METASITANHIAEALKHFGLRPIGSPTIVADSVSNQNYRAQTNSGLVFVKAHRANRTPERVEREQAAIRWAARAGLPVAEPLAAPSGESLLFAHGRFWSVYPWLEGHTWQRGAISAPRAHALGALQGRVQATLRAYPPEGLPNNSELTWDTPTSIEVLRELEPLVAEHGTELEQRWVRHQRELLESGVAIPCASYEGLALQPTHGDFHERNIMLGADDQVLAIVDWERFCLQPPAFEVLCGASFMLLLEEPLLRAYLEGYRTNAKLESSTAERCVEAWWQSALHNTWALRDYFIAGNAATRQFLPEEENRSRKFNDPAFREWLTSMLVRYAC